MLDIVTLGSRGEEILKGTSSLIADIDENIFNISQAMIEAMILGNGVGLAGPQVDFARRIFVTKVNGDIARVFINPEIIRTSVEVVPFEEGCLSIPGVYADVIRPQAVSIQAWDEKGKLFKLDAEGMLARVIQHEYDHLKGVLFIDHLNEKKRERVLKIYSRKLNA